MSAAELQTNLLRLILDTDDKLVLQDVMAYVQQTLRKNKKPIKDLSKYRGSINTGLNMQTLEHQIKQMRDEWERDTY
jgi:uncharacterized protein YeeX (DUF496 family)